MVYIISIYNTKKCWPIIGYRSPAFGRENARCKTHDGHFWSARLMWFFQILRGPFNLSIKEEFAIRLLGRFRWPPFPNLNTTPQVSPDWLTVQVKYFDFGPLGAFLYPPSTSPVRPTPPSTLPVYGFGPNSNADSVEVVPLFFGLDRRRHEIVSVFRMKLYF